MRLSRTKEPFQSDRLDECATFVVEYSLPRTWINFLEWRLPLFSEQKEKESERRREKEKTRKKNTISYSGVIRASHAGSNPLVYSHRICRLREHPSLATIFPAIISSRTSSIMRSPSLPPLRARKLSRDGVLHAIIRQMAGSVSREILVQRPVGQAQTMLGYVLLGNDDDDIRRRGSSIDVVVVSRPLASE